METLKDDLDQDEVFVFTPKGDVVTMPAGATPIDFAYSIHTDVGHRCIGAKVNGRLVPLDSALSSGDTVEVFTSKVEGAGPSRDWLQIVVTPRAQNKIRQWFSREPARGGDRHRAGGAGPAHAAGGPAGAEADRRRRCCLSVAVAMNYTDLDSLHAAIGEGHVSAHSVAQRVTRELQGGVARGAAAGHRPPPVTSPARAARSASTSRAWTT